MGGEWRIPTQSECQELLDNTTNEWTTINNVNGWKFTSKIDTSKYIFIPAAGYCDNGSVNVGGSGFVWSSSLNASILNDDWVLYFDSDYCYMDYDIRYKGRSVRGVRK